MVVEDGKAKKIATDGRRYNETGETMLKIFFGLEDALTVIQRNDILQIFCPYVIDRSYPIIIGILQRK